MELKRGYKQTEVGVIPEEWEVKRLGDVVDFLDGRRRPVKDSDRAKMRGDIPYYGASGIVDYVNDFLFNEDLILLGEDGENILSRNCRLAFKISGKTWVNNHAHVLRPKPGTSLDYLTEFLESRDYAQYNTGTAQPKLNQLVCSRIPVFCPPPHEQRAIARALSDVDALISALDQLIAKKCDLKQAAMQQLLTGQKRLPRFHGEWEVKQVLELGQVVTGGTPRTDVEAFWGNGYPWITPTDISIHRDMFTSERTLTEKGLNAIRALPANTVLVTCIASIGKNAILKTVGGCNQQINAVTPNKNNSAEFLYYVFEASKQYLLANAGTTATSIISKAAFAQLAFKVPSLVEQSAIAEVLSDMDAELAALEQRRDKTRALKLGMMQELLTGRTRLVDSPPSYG